MKLLTFGYALTVIMFMGFTLSPPNVVIYGLLFALAGVYIAAEDTLRRFRVRADGGGATPIFKNLSIYDEVHEQTTYKASVVCDYNINMSNPRTSSIENNEN